MRATRGGAQSRHREPPGSSRIDALIQKRRSEANSIRDGVIPPRGYTFDDGETFDGLPGNRLKYRDLTNDELATNSVDGRAIANASVTNDHITALNVSKLVGAATGDKIAEGLIPALSRIGGKVNANHQIDWGPGAPVPAGKVQSGYHWDKIKGRPRMSKYLTRADFRSDGTLKR